MQGIDDEAVPFDAVLQTGVCVYQGRVWLPDLDKHMLINNQHHMAGNSLWLGQWHPGPALLVSAQGPAAGMKYKLIASFLFAPLEDIYPKAFILVIILFLPLSASAFPFYDKQLLIVV